MVANYPSIFLKKLREWRESRGINVSNDSLAASPSSSAVIKTCSTLTTTPRLWPFYISISRDSPTVILWPGTIPWRLAACWRLKLSTLSNSFDLPLLLSQKFPFKVTVGSMEAANSSEHHPEGNYQALFSNCTWISHLPPLIRNPSFLVACYATL